MLRSGSVLMRRYLEAVVIGESLTRKFSVEKQNVEIAKRNLEMDNVGNIVKWRLIFCCPSKMKGKVTRKMFGIVPELERLI